MLYFHRQMKLYTWNKADYSIIFAGNIFSFLLCFVCLQPCYQLHYTTIQKWCSTAFALKCACLKGKYRFSCRWRDFPTITAVYVSHGLSIRQSDPKTQLQQTCIQSDLQYHLALLRNWSQVSCLLFINTNHCTTDHTWSICRTQKLYLQYCDRQTNISKKFVLGVMNYSLS